MSRQLPITVPFIVRGFAFIELLLVIAVVIVVASALVPEIAMRVDSHRETITRAEMVRLLAAIRGDPRTGQSGFVSHMGRLPSGNQLDELGIQGDQPDYVIGLGGVGMGWAGPYVSADVTGGDWRRDAWNHAYRFSSTTGQLTSAGRDGTFGTADDLVMPDQALQYQGDLTVTVRADDAHSPGTTTTLTGATARVEVYYPVNGVETVADLTWNGAVFAWPGGLLFPAGTRAVHVIGLNGGSAGDYTGRETVITAVVRSQGAAAVAYLPGEVAVHSDDTDGDGVPDPDDICLTTSPATAVNRANGCSI